MTKKSHVYILDICRFFAILMIMGHHSYIVGNSGNYPFANAWLWVEYFFMITGYMTMAHFSRNAISDNQIGQEAFFYTLRKFKAFLPYLIPTIFIQYVVEAFPYLKTGEFASFIKSFINFPFECLMLTSGGFGGAKLAPIWYLSAMFLVLPILICLMLGLKKYWPTISLFVPLIYYGWAGIHTDRSWPNDMLRAFFAMMFGMFCYYVSDWIRSKEWTRIQIIMLTIAETVGFAVPVFITATNKEWMYWIVLMFPLNIGIMLSGISYTSLIKGRWLKLLGEISLPMFIIHWPIGVVSWHFCKTEIGREFFYFALTLLVSIILVLVKEKWLRLRKEGK